MDFIKIRNFCSKDTGKRMVRQATQLEKNLQTIYMMKDLYPEYTSKNSHNSIRKTSNPVKTKWAFHQRRYTDGTHKRLLSLVIRETETTIVCHYTSIRMAKITNKTILIIHGLPMIGATEKVIYCQWECKMVQSLLPFFVNFMKSSIHLPYDSFQGIYPGKIKTCLHKDLFANVYSSIIHNRQRLNTK